MVKRKFAALTIVIFVATLSGCTSSAGGSPTPAVTPSAGPGTGSATNAGGTSLTSVDPCSLLTGAQISQYQLAKVKSGSGLGARYCQWQGPGTAANGGVGDNVQVNIYDTAGTDQLNSSGYTIINFPVGQHQGRLIQSTTGDICAVSISVTNNSRVDISGQSGSGEIADSCQVAEKYGSLVEQNLVALGR